MKYIFYKEDFSDNEWYDLIYLTEDLPEYNELFDNNGEIIDKYTHLFEPYAVYELAHDSIRITNFGTLQTFLLEYGMCNNDMTDNITNAIADHKNSPFYFQGDGEGFGFILDFFTDNTYEECLETESQQFWFKDYQLD